LFTVRSGKYTTLLQTNHSKSARWGSVGRFGVSPVQLRIPTKLPVHQ
jgi:hypothetical protein